MREIVLDTETTGIDPFKGDRLCEIGCVEIINRFPTGKVFHAYINPQRSMPIDAFKVHGLSEAFLADKPVFNAVADDFLRFIGEDPLIIHNASFDMGFLNLELKKSGRAPLQNDRVIDTLIMARRKHPGQSNSLDALCARYGISNAHRVKHGALLDAELLAEIYGELTGGRQASLILAQTADKAREEPESLAPDTMIDAAPETATVLEALPLISPEERAAHRAFLQELGPDSLWCTYIEGPQAPIKKSKA